MGASALLEPEDDEGDPVLEQPDSVMPNATSKNAQQLNAAILRDLRLSRPANSNPVKTKLAGNKYVPDGGRKSRSKMSGANPLSLCLPDAPVTAALAQAVELV